MKKQSNWLDAAEVRAMLHISRNTLLNWRKRGILTAHRMPGSRRTYYDRDEVDALLQRHAIQENHHLDTTIFVEKGIDTPP